MFSWFWQVRSLSSDTNIDVEQSISDGIEKLQLLLSKDDITLTLIFQKIENAQDPNELLQLFAKINRFFRYLLRIEPSQETYGRVRTAVENLDTSFKFLTHMKSEVSFEDALYRYKQDIVRTLSSDLKKSKDEDIRRSHLDLDLIQSYFPKSTSKSSMEQEEQIMEGILPDRKNNKRRRGDSSPSAHYQSSRPRFTDHGERGRKNVCYDFQVGKCSRGRDCRFKHIN